MFSLLQFKGQNGEEFEKRESIFSLKVSLKTDMIFFENKQVRIWLSARVQG
jgi:hypothetical protein